MNERKDEGMGNSSSTIQKQVSEKEFLAYIGLEIAMGIVKLNQIRDYWLNKLFNGHAHFKETISRDRFSEIRSSVQFHFSLEFTTAERSKDPLWHSRNLLRPF